MAHYDITHLLARYLDRHMVLPLLEFISGKDIYDVNSLLDGKQELLENTKMVDYSTDVYKARFPNQANPPMSMIEKRSEVLEQMKILESKVEDAITLLTDEENADVLRDGRQMLELLLRHGFKVEEIFEDFYKCAKFNYDCGIYTRCSQYLYFLNIMLPATDKNYMNTLWGKLATNILIQDWENAVEDIKKLKEILDINTSSPPLVLLQQRAWLIHWSLFVYFNHVKGHDAMIEVLLYNSNYLNTIQTTCPHILRYLTAAVVINMRKRQSHPSIIKDLVKVILQESYTYKDPVTEFMECLYVNFDFDGAQMKLKECVEVFLHDFFLVGCLEDFIENARLLVFETFCKVHKCISISALAEKLNMEKEEEAEKWIVNLIRNASLNAKIDSKQGLVLIGSQATNVYQQVIDKTKNLSLKSQTLVFNLEKKFGSKENENQWND